MKRRIFERFDPNAIDGDDDGLVQDATAFERPAKPRVSGSIRIPEPEAMPRGNRRGMGRSNFRRSLRPFKRRSGPHNSVTAEDDLYDEMLGPKDPKSRSRQPDTGRMRPTNAPSSVSERIEEARKQRAQYWEKYRDPKTGKLNIPVPKRQRATSWEANDRLKKMRRDLISGKLSELSPKQIADRYKVPDKIVKSEIEKTKIAVRDRKRRDFTAPQNKPNKRRISGSMSWGRFNPPKPQLRDIGAELELENEVDEELSSRSIDKPETFNVAGIDMRQWNEFSSDMMAYLQESLTDPKFEYGDSKTQSRERRRSLMRAIAAIKQANVKKNEDGSLSMDFTDESIRRLRTVLRVLKEQDVENVRHIDLLRDNLPNKKSRGSQKSAWPTRTLINVKDGLGMPRTVRIGDPDVFDNQTSALKRSRDLGCIGIRRYSTANGELAWMPCTNESDYRRRRGVGPQAARDRKKREDELAKRIERRVGRLMRAKSAQIGILEKINKTNTIIKFVEKPSTYVDGKRFVNAGLRTVENNVG